MQPGSLVNLPSVILEYPPFMEASLAKYLADHISLVRYIPLPWSLYPMPEPNLDLSNAKNGIAVP